jgi:methionine--tRNA ligase beta chain
VNTDKAAEKEVKQKQEVKTNKPSEKEENKTETKTESNTKKENPKKQEQKQNINKNQTKKEDENTHPLSKLDIRVGKVVSINVNEKSEKLYNEEIDIGNGEIRKIASGLKGRVNIEDLRDSLVIVLANLKPRTLCEWTSHGMILCASDEKGNIEPIRPPSGSKPGDAVTIGDYPRLPVPELNPKKNPWEQVGPEMVVNSDKLATYQGTHIWKTENGNIGTTVLTSGRIS